MEALDYKKKHPVQGPCNKIIGSVDEIFMTFFFSFVFFCEKVTPILSCIDRSVIHLLKNNEKKNNCF